MRNFSVCIIDGGMLRRKEITNRAGLVFLANGRVRLAGRLICWVVMRVATVVYVLTSVVRPVAASMQAKKGRVMQDLRMLQNAQ